MANRTAASLFGTTVDRLVGVPFTRFICFDDQDVYYLFQRRLVAPPTAASRCELRLVSGDGTRFWADLRTTKEASVYGDSTQRLVIVDISDRRQLIEMHSAHEELRRQKDLAEASRLCADAANQAKDVFLRTMSHEIRTPLNGMLGMTELLLGSGLTDEQHEYAHAAFRSGKTLLHVLNNILDFSQINAGELRLEMIPFNPAEIVHDVVGLFRPGSATTGIELLVRIAPGLPSSDLGDPFRWRQILNNLVSNALKFTSRGHVLVELELVDGAYRLTVSDTGIGITADRLPLLFAPFVQADSSTTRRFGGSGLGLVIARRIAEAMGGSLNVTSVVGAGTSFIALLPSGTGVATRHLTESRGQAPAALTTPHRFHARAPIAAEAPVTIQARVLLVEDDEISRRVAQIMLSQHVTEVITANDGQEAVDRASAPGVDVIFMDCQMPLLDGWEATRLIRTGETTRGSPRVPIIAMTGNALAGDRERCLAAGMDDYLAKPVTQEQILAMLHKWLGGMCRMVAAGTQDR